MNAVVRGRQWYWRFKFLPLAKAGENLCVDCEKFFRISKKHHYWFERRSNAGKTLLPSWRNHTQAIKNNKDKYWIRSKGIPQDLSLPMPVNDILERERHITSMEKVNNWFFDPSKIKRHRDVVLPKKQFEYHVSDSDKEDLYWRKVNWHEINYIRKQQFIYNVDSYSQLKSSVGVLRNLEAELPLVLPSRKLIRFFFWSSDVIHRFAIPELMVKLDCVPGRLNNSYVFIRHVGKYFGQCSELCGVYHSFMPINIEAYLYSKKVKICFGKHYEKDYGEWWDLGFVRGNMLVRLLRSICLPILWVMGWAHFITNVHMDDLLAHPLYIYSGWVYNYFYNVYKLIIEE